MQGNHVFFRCEPAFHINNETIKEERKKERKPWQQSTQPTPLLPPKKNHACAAFFVASQSHGRADVPRVAM